MVCLFLQMRCHDHLKFDRKRVRVNSLLWVLLWICLVSHNSCGFWKKQMDVAHVHSKKQEQSAQDLPQSSPQKQIWIAVTRKFYRKYVILLRITDSKLYAASVFFLHFIHQWTTSRSQLALAGVLFILLTPLILWFDSIDFATQYAGGRWLANGSVLLYFMWLYSIVGTQLRKLIFTMFFISYIGELIFSTLLGMYYYRTPHIPLYVPLGHAIVYTSGAIYAQSDIAIKMWRCWKSYSHCCL